MSTSKPICECGQKAGPSGLCDECFLNRSPALGSLSRPLKRDEWTRGFICAVAKYVEMYGDGTEAKELLRLCGKREHMLKHADEEDLITLREAKLIP